MIMGSSVPATHARSKFLEIQCNATFDMFDSNRKSFLHPGRIVFSVLIISIFGA